MKRVLILTGRYLPGHKDGGPLRTIFNLTDALGDEYDFRIVALDRDHGDREPYRNIQRNAWNQVGKAKVWYVSPGEINCAFIKKMSADMDVIYCCGFYDDYGRITLLLHRIGRLKGKKIVVASMGSFTRGALSQKPIKKKLGISLFRVLGLFHNITWSVSSEEEKQDVRHVIGTNASCVVAEDLPRSTILGRNKLPDKSNKLNVVFLSRIHPMKNLIGAIQSLQNCRRDIFFTICGPVSDPRYWEECQRLLNKLPDNIEWEYKGDILSENVPEEFLKYDVFLFPTLGENYGHVIFEALSSGCIPVISDQTPWKNLSEDNCGFVLPLEEDMCGFSKTVDGIADMSREEIYKMSKNAVEHAGMKIRTAISSTGYRTIFK